MNKVIRHRREMEEDDQYGGRKMKILIGIGRN